MKGRNRNRDPEVGAWQRGLSWLPVGEVDLGSLLHDVFGTLGRSPLAVRRRSDQKSYRPGLAALHGRRGCGLAKSRFCKRGD